MTTRLLLLPILAMISTAAAQIFPTDSPCSAFPKIDMWKPQTGGAGRGTCQNIGGVWCPSSGNPWCIDGCSTNAKSCRNPNVANNLGNCDRRCQWCYDQRDPDLRCQVNHLDCLVNGRIEVLPNHVNPLECQQAQGKFCPTLEPNYPWCIKPQPALAQCFESNPERFDIAYDNEWDCHTGGGVWCDNPKNPRVCIKQPDAPCSSDPDVCCPERDCMAESNPDMMTCLLKGCKFCDIDGGICSLGGNSDCQIPNRENCFPNGDNLLASEATCAAMGNCKWCPKSNEPYCALDYPATCSANNRVECKKRGITDYKTCKLWGCEWCGDDQGELACIESTTCSTCNCPTKQDCFATTEEACNAKQCRWCPDSEIKCINVNSEGVTEPGVWCPCSKSCGCGVQYQIDPGCKDPNIRNCDRIYRSCNTHDCETAICAEGELMRYEDSRTCCMSHTRACGRNTLNDMCLADAEQDDEPVTIRRRRVIAGDDIGSIAKWPWLGVIYPNGTTKCGITVITDRFAVTARSCVEGFDKAGMSVNFATYDRDEVAGVEVGVAEIFLDGAVAFLHLDTRLDFGPNLSPICMPRGEVVPQDTTCVIAGWGRTVANDPDSCSPVARDATVKILPWVICAQAWDLPESDEEFICAGFPEGSSDSCAGDEGGPLMCQRCSNCGWYLAGVITHLQGCGTPQKPTVYARMSFHETYAESDVDQYDSLEIDTFMCD